VPSGKVCAKAVPAESRTGNPSPDDVLVPDACGRVGADPETGIVGAACGDVGCAGAAGAWGATFGGDALLGGGLASYPKEQPITGRIADATSQRSRWFIATSPSVHHEPS
jgi:hypothetical protein